MADAQAQSWAKNYGKGGGDAAPPIDEDEPMPHEEPDGDEGGQEEPMGTKSPEDLDTIVELARAHLPEIEESLQGMEPETLLRVDEELPEESADVILEMIEGWEDGLPDLLTDISEPEALHVSEMLSEDVTEVDPVLVGAWLFRAGQLTA